MLALRLDCSTAALTTLQKVLPSYKLIELVIYLALLLWPRIGMSESHLPQSATDGKTKH